MTARSWRRPAPTVSEVAISNAVHGVWRGSGWTRRISAAICVCLLGFQIGCYTFLPITSTVPQADRVAVVLNDVGRVQAGPTLGPGVDWVEGAIAGQDSLKVRLLVNQVRDLRGGTSTWTGEEVEIAREGIAGFRALTLSKQRSWLLAGVVVGAVVISIVMTNLSLFGDGEGDEICRRNCNPNPSIRW